MSLPETDEHNESGKPGSSTEITQVSSLNGSTTPFGDWRESILKLFSDIKNYCQDRQAILVNPTLIRDGTIHLKSRPFKFALNGLLLPGLVIGLLYSGFSAIYPLPPEQIDRSIEEQKNIRKILDDALHNEHLQATQSEPDWARAMSTVEMEKESERNTQRLNELNGKKDRTGVDQAELDVLRKRTLEFVPVFDNRIMRDLQVSTLAAQKEAATNQLNLMRLKKFVGIVNGWQSFLIGLSLLIAAYFFGWRIRRLRPVLPFAFAGRDAYLYLIGASLVVPNIAAALLNVGLDLSIRFDVTWFLRIQPFLAPLLVVWAVVISLRVARMLAEVLGDPVLKADGKPQRRVMWRLLFSQIVAGIGIQVLVGAIGLPLYWVITKLQK
jgi:hypothetical protein